MWDLLKTLVFTTVGLSVVFAGIMVIGFLSIIIWPLLIFGGLFFIIYMIIVDEKEHRTKEKTHDE